MRKGSRLSIPECCSLALIREVVHQKKKCKPQKMRKIPTDPICSGMEQDTTGVFVVVVVFFKSMADWLSEFKRGSFGKLL